MSAWIVSKKHVDLMVAAIVYGTRDGKLPPWKGRIDPTRLGDVLVKECVASVAYRYDEKPEDGTLPGPADCYYLVPYIFEHPNYLPTANEMRSAVSCYDYQSCEHPGWKGSSAHQWCEYVLGIIGEKGDGRDDSPWGFDAEDIAICAAKADADGFRLALTASKDKAAVGPLSDWLMERSLLSEPLTENVQIAVKEPVNMATARREQEREQHVKNYPHLTTKTAKPSYSPGRLAAENIRKELKKSFPLSKFSVRSDFNSVNVEWTHGPKPADVETIANRYKRGNFDGMSDCYESNHDNTFADVFGDPEYVFCERRYTKETFDAVCETVAKDYGWESNDQKTYNMAYRILRQSSLIGHLSYNARRKENQDGRNHEDYWEVYPVEV